MNARRQLLAIIPAAACAAVLAIVALLAAAAIAPAHATTLGAEGTPADASALLAAAVDTTHRSSLTTPANPGARPVNAPVPPAMNSKLAEAQIVAQRDLAAETARITEASAQNSTTVVDRLASEFGMTSRDLVAEQRDFDASLGDLLVAHILVASSDGNATVQSLFEARAKGSGWGAIASDMGFDLDAVVAAMRQETQVATGVVRGDGKLVTLGRGNATNATTVEKSHSGATVIRGSGVDTTRATKSAEK